MQTGIGEAVDRIAGLVFAFVVAKYNFIRYMIEYVVYVRLCILSYIVGGACYGLPVIYYIVRSPL